MLRPNWFDKRYEDELTVQEILDRLSKDSYLVGKVKAAVEEYDKAPPVKGPSRSQVIRSEIVNCLMEPGIP